ncbi:MAG: VWA domain-containing protein [Deltaproteobacteria bacterium]|jgi:uncharacterized protein YegL|nr:VWA domain-containing protein [Deltaproteobacteria bacterium]
MRKLPIYILIDTSGSMRGEPIESVKVGLKSLVSSLKRDPYAMETVYISIITFDREAKVILPLSPIDNLNLPRIPPVKSSPTNMGEALALMLMKYDKEVVKNTLKEKGDWTPMAVVMTDGSPSDTMLFEDTCEAIKRYKFSRIIGCAAGPKAKYKPLTKFCTDVVILETMDANSFSMFWRWVSVVFTQKSRSSSITDIPLPPPPKEIRIPL